MAYSSMSLSKTENFNRRQMGCCRSCLRGFVRSLNVILMVVGVGFLAYGGTALHFGLAMVVTHLDTCAAYLGIEQKSINLLSGS